MAQYKCMVCGYVYDPAEGDIAHDVKPDTAFENISEDWQCPICGVNKFQFEKIG